MKKMTREEIIDEIKEHIFAWKEWEKYSLSKKDDYSLEGAKIYNNYIFALMDLLYDIDKDAYKEIGGK